MEIVIKPSKHQEESVTSTSLAKVRRNAARCIEGLLDGGVTPAQAEAVYKQNLTIIDSYRQELKAIDTAYRLGNEQVDFNKALSMIGKIDIE